MNPSNRQSNDMDTAAKIFIRQPGAAPFPCTLPAGEYTIGRSEKCRMPAFFQPSIMALLSSRIEGTMPK